MQNKLDLAPSNRNGKAELMSGLTPSGFSKTAELNVVHCSFMTGAPMKTLNTLLSSSWSLLSHTILVTPSVVIGKTWASAEILTNTALLASCQFSIRLLNVNVLHPIALNRIRDVYSFG